MIGYESQKSPENHTPKFLNQQYQEWAVLCAECCEVTWNVFADCAYVWQLIWSELSRYKSEFLYNFSVFTRISVSRDVRILKICRKRNRCEIFGETVMNYWDPKGGKTPEWGHRRLNGVTYVSILILSVILVWLWLIVPCDFVLKSSRTIWVEELWPAYLWICTSVPTCVSIDNRLSSCFHHVFHFGDRVIRGLINQTVFQRNI